MKKKSITGVDGEKVAAEYLVRRGFSILDRNYRRPWGELDIVAERKGIVHFFEVKTRTCSLDGSRENYPIPEELVTTDKLRKVARTAALYMEVKRDAREYQIDVVGVLLDEMRRVAQCRYFPQVLGE